MNAATHRDLRVKLFADAAELDAMRELAANPRIAGFTTNPTLMRGAGVTDYEGFARDALAAVPDRPISFEVFADEPAEILAQAMTIAAWGDNVYVKIPTTNTRGESTADVVRDLSRSGVQVNVTAVLTQQQVETAADSLRGGAASNISVFAGRIADTGRDPVQAIRAALETIAQLPNVELIWASPREVLNVAQADETGCHIITMTPALLAKLDLLGHGLEAFSLETVQMFHRDAAASGLALPVQAQTR